MILTKLLRSQLKYLFAVTLVPISVISYPMPVRVQPEPPSGNSSKQIEIYLLSANTDSDRGTPPSREGTGTRIHFIPAASPTPPDRGTPPTNDGTGSRGGCPYKKELPPMTNLTGSKNLELTLNAHPTFWVYVPYSQHEVVSGEFSLQEGDNEVYSTHFQLPTTPGIVSISLPPTLKPLEVGKTYNWYFNINCSPTKLSEPPDTVMGQVQRVTRSGQFDSEFKTAKTPLERIAIYAKHHAWYDTLTELAQLRLNEPQDSTLKQVWVELLSDRNVGLAQVAQEPIVGAVTPNPRSESR
jgi:hypothetical protein